MKNKEKFAEQILDIVCKGNDVALDISTGSLCACQGFSCGECYFYLNNYPNGTKICRENLAHWANAEYKEKKEFSEADKLYVRAMDKLNWFAKDRNGLVFGYVDKPLKTSGMWYVEVEVGDKSEVEKVSSYSSATFEPLSWDDEEPTHRNKILENEETGKYTEILKLKEMLEEANIPFTFTDDFFGAKKRGCFEENSYPAYQIRLNMGIDVVQHFGSYGEDENLLEIMGGLTMEESKESGVLGHLTAEEVFKRFKYCYENGTTFYKEEQK